MDDFRVGSIFSNTPYGQEKSNADGRKKDKQPKDLAPGQADEDIVSISGHNADDETVEDYYTPSRRDEEPE